MRVNVSFENGKERIPGVKVNFNNIGIPKRD